jgi:hypothetical protein
MITDEPSRQHSDVDTQFVYNSLGELGSGFKLRW